MSRSSRYLRSSYGTSGSSPLTSYGSYNANSPTTNTSSAYSSYLLRNSSSGYGSGSYNSTSDASYSSPGRRRYTAAAAADTDISVSAAATARTPLRSYRGARSTQELSSLANDTSTNWRSNYGLSSRDDSSIVRHRSRSNTRSCSSDIGGSSNNYLQSSHGGISSSLTAAAAARDFSSSNRVEPSQMSFRDRDISLSRDRDISLSRDVSNNVRFPSSSEDCYSRGEPAIPSAYNSPTKEYYRTTSAMNGMSSPTSNNDMRGHRSSSSNREEFNYEPQKYVSRRPHQQQQFSSLTRSSSFKDLREFDPDYDYLVRPSTGSTRKQRARHQTLAYGVSAADLGLAKVGGTDFAAEWRSLQVPRMAVKGTTDHNNLRGFASDMSVGGSMVSNSGGSNSSKGGQSSSSSSDDAGYSSQSVSRRGSRVIPSSVTIAELEMEARRELGASMGDAPRDDLIVIRKNDLNSILTAKPTLLIGREISLDSRGTVSNNVRASSSPPVAVASSSRSHNDIDYKKLWEDSQKENVRLKDELGKLRDDLSNTRRKLDAAHSSSSSNLGLSETERREKKALERKLTEMEEELKLLALSENLTDQQLRILKIENERLKSENRALTRVVAKLTAASALPKSKVKTTQQQ